MYVTKKLNKALANLLVKKLKLRSMQEKRLRRHAYTTYNLSARMEFRKAFCDSFKDSNIWIESKPLKIIGFEHDYPGSVVNSELIYGTDIVSGKIKYDTEIQLPDKAPEGFEARHAFLKDSTRNAVIHFNPTDPRALGSAPSDDAVFRIWASLIAEKNTHIQKLASKTDIIKKPDSEIKDENELVYNQTNLQLRTLDDGTDEAYS